MLGGVVLALLNLACFRLGFNLATTMCLFLILIVVQSLWANFVSSIAVSLAAAAALTYYFAPPLFSFRINDTFELVATLVFLAVSAGMTSWAVSIRRSR